MTPSIITTTTTASQPPIPPTPIPSDILQTLLTFASVFRFEDRVKSLEVNFSEFMRTNQSPEAVSNIPGIVHQYMHQEMTEAVRQAVKSQVKAQVTRILPRIEESVNAQLEAEVLTRSSHSSRTSYVVAADLSEIELKKILIDKMEGNKSIQRLDEQWNLYKALIEAYDTDKTILDSYGESAILKRRREDDDDQEGPSAGSDRGLRDREKVRSMHQPALHLNQLPGVQAGNHQHRIAIGTKLLPAVQGIAQSWISELAKQTNARSSFNKLLDTLIDFSNFIMNRLGVNTLTPKLLAGPTYELMRGSCNSLTELEYHLEEVYKATTDQLDWVYPEGQQYPHNLLQPLPLILDNWGRRFYGFAVNRESALDVYSKRRIIAVTDLKIVEWHNYKHLDWISVRRDDDKIYTFKKGDFKRLCLQDIEDMLLLLIQGKLSNLTVEEHFAFNVSLRMFTRSIVIQRRVKDLQLGVESYQKRLNLTKPDTDGMLNDVRNALDDRLKGIRMQYLPTTIWRKGDKDRAAAMIQAIDKMLKTRRIMRSLERFVGGRQYEGDFRMLQRTI
nr:hypothetical protein [Tanacetum cinerariifolium]